MKKRTLTLEEQLQRVREVCARASRYEGLGYEGDYYLGYMAGIEGLLDDLKKALNGADE